MFPILLSWIFTGVGLGIGYLGELIRNSTSYTKVNPYNPKSHIVTLTFFVLGNLIVLIYIIKWSCKLDLKKIVFGE